MDSGCEFSVRKLVFSQDLHPNEWSWNVTQFSKPIHSLFFSLNMVKDIENGVSREKYVCKGVDQVYYSISEK